MGIHDAPQIAPHKTHIPVRFVCVINNPCNFSENPWFPGL